jgi:alanine racemase
MDQCQVDVTDVPAVAVGDVATLIGGAQTVGQMATLLQTTTREITTVLGKRVLRVYSAP